MESILVWTGIIVGGICLSYTLLFFGAFYILMTKEVFQ